MSMDEADFRRAADTAMEALKQALIDAEEDGGFEVEESSGALYVLFENPPGKFVVTPNAAIRQIWISALSTSYKLDCVDGGFLLPKTGEALLPLLHRLIDEHLASA